MDDFNNLSNKIEDIKKSLSDIEVQSLAILDCEQENSEDLQTLSSKIKALLNKMGVDTKNNSVEEDIQDINAMIDRVLFTEEDKTTADKALDLNNSDLVIACLAGGLAVIVDFIIVKVPKDMNIKLNGKTVHHEGTQEP